MNEVDHAVVIVGGGPVGLTLAIELGWRGVDCLLVEAGDGSATNPRCNTTAARSMEIFRRLGVADRIREAGLPGDYPTTVQYRTRFAGGHELRRLPLPSSDEVRLGVDRESWPGPEPQHRVAQIYLEPVLRDHLRSFPSVQTCLRTRAVGVEQDADGVVVRVQDADGRCRAVRSRYLVGCDGAHSVVRSALGIRLSGVGELGSNCSLLVRSAELGRLKSDRAWSTVIFNPENVSAMIAIDGDELWLSHHKFPIGFDTSALDPADLLAKAVGHPVEHEVVGEVHWTPRRLVAERFADGRVFLAGDAAHLWIPMAGFGMNAGIQEAATLGWMLAAVVRGWAAPALLDAYDRERRPVGEAVADAVAGVRIYELPVDEQLEDDSPDGEQARSALASALALGDQGQYTPDGLSFAITYRGSPVIADDGSPPAPPLEISRYEPSARPGSRLPHFWYPDGTSLYDHLGPDFSLLVLDDAPDLDAWTAAAALRHMPLAVVRVPGEHEQRLGATQLLVRPDQYVAWRGPAVPDDPGAVLDLVRGAGVFVEAAR